MISKDSLLFCSTKREFWVKDSKEIVNFCLTKAASSCQLFIFLTVFPMLHGVGGDKGTLGLTTGWKDDKWVAGEKRGFC